MVTALNALFIFAAIVLTVANIILCGDDIDREDTDWDD